MTATATIKYPLLFAENQTTGDVHTSRGGKATCGAVLLSHENKYSQDPIQITCEKCLENYVDRFQWTVTFTVHPTWVADGFDLDDERARELIGDNLRHAMGDEYDAKVTSAPDPDEVAMEQGYKDAAHRARCDR